MMSSTGGKSCKNCKALLIPPKWEDLMMFPIFLFAMLVPQFAHFNITQTGAFIIIFLLIVMYLTAAFVPFEIKSKR